MPLSEVIPSLGRLCGLKNGYWGRDLSVWLISRRAFLFWVSSQLQLSGQRQIPSLLSQLGLCVPCREMKELGARR